MGHVQTSGTPSISLLDLKVSITNGMIVTCTFKKALNKYLYMLPQSALALFLWQHPSILAPKFIFLKITKAKSVSSLQD
jgi:hypothetical protein